MEGKNGFRSMLTCKEAAEFIGITRDRFYHILRESEERNKKIPHYLFRKKRFFKEEDLEKWIEQHRC